MACLAACFLLSVALGAVVAIDIWPPIHPAGTRISFGKPAMTRQFPYMAHIYATNYSGKHSRNCAGSLVTRDAVLTSAHCVHRSTDFTVRLGSIHRTEEDRSAWTVESIWVVVHPKYNSTSYESNVAIIFLPVKAPLSDYIQLVDLPSPLAGSFIGSIGIVSGWGQTNPGSSLPEVLRWAEITVIPNDICRTFFPKYVAITERSMCAGSVTSTVLSNDYGAPLVLKTREGYTQIGIFSNYLGHTYYNTSKPVNFARLTSYLDWIRQKTGPE